jgi:phage head maturation protease
VINFAPKGVSEIADETCALAKAGVLNAVSIGFRPLKSEPLRTGGQKFTKWELLELSIVSVPANPSALIVQRAHPRAVRLKEGRVISGENADHLAAVRDCLRRLRAVHADLANKADELAEIDTARRTVLARMQALGEKWQSHLLALSGEDNAELGAEAEREKRIKVASDLRVAASSPFIAVPDSFKVIDPRRQVVATIAHAAPTTRGDKWRSFDPSRGYIADYLKYGPAVLFEHEAPPIAWCIDVIGGSDSMTAIAQFPPIGVSALADEIFRQVGAGIVTGASIGSGWLKDDAAMNSGVLDVRDWELREWSLVRQPANPLARVISVGGKTFRVRPLVCLSERPGTCPAPISLKPGGSGRLSASRRAGRVEFGRRSWLHRRRPSAALGPRHARLGVSVVRYPEGRLRKRRRGAPRPSLRRRTN